jgi:hypothetical protein
MESRMPLAGQRLSNTANRKFKGETTMKTTTLRTKGLENEGFRELTVDEMADMTGGLFEQIYQMWFAIAVLPGAVASASQTVSTPHPFLP